MNGFQQLRRLVPSYQKVSGARAVGAVMVPERNRSRSFQLLWRTIGQLMAGSLT